MASEGRDRPEAVRCRAVDVGGDAGPARSRQRDRLASLRRQASVPPVPVLAWSGRVQQAAAQVRRAVAGDDPAARRRHRRVGRRHLADRLDADRVRPIAAHHATIQPRRLGRLRLLRVALPLLLGAAPAPRVHPGRTADHVRLGQPESRRTRRRHRHVRSRTRPARRTPRSNRSSPTRATPRPSSSVDSPNTASNWSAPPAPTSPAAAAHRSCDASARSSNRSTTP